MTANDSEIEAIDTAKSLLAFAEQALPSSIAETEIEPGEPNDWDDAYTSLISHDCVKKMVRIVIPCGIYTEF